MVRCASISALYSSVVTQRYASVSPFCIRRMLSGTSRRSRKNAWKYPARRYKPQGISSDSVVWMPVSSKSSRTAPCTAVSPDCTQPPVISQRPAYFFADALRVIRKRPSLRSVMTAVSIRHLPCGIGVPRSTVPQICVPVLSYKSSTSVVTGTASFRQKPNGQFSFACLEILSSTPISASCIISAVPPYEKNGSEMPVGGIALLTTAIFSSACKPICMVKPTATSIPNLSFAFAAI